MPRLLLALACVCSASAQSLEQAADRLATKAASTLRSSPPVAISVENRSSLSTPADRVRAILDRHINSGATPPPGAPTLKVFISDSASSQLLIATSDCGESPCVSMERFRAGTDKPAALLTVRPVIQQPEPILDFTLTPDNLVVLEPARVAIHNGADKYFLFAPAAPMPRDPRGRLFVRDGGYEVRIPGSVCTGTTAMTCNADDTPWQEGEVQVSWIPRRNVLVLPAGFEGEDLAYIKSKCGTMRLVAAGNAVEGRGVQPVALPGPVMALWSSETASEASLVVFNSSNRLYEASRIAIRCDR